MEDYNKEEVEAAKRRLASRIYKYTCKECGLTRELAVKDSQEKKRMIMNELAEHNDNVHKRQITHTSRLSEN